MTIFSCFQEELEAIAKMRQTITEMKEGTHGFQ